MLEQRFYWRKEMVGGKPWINLIRVDEIGVRSVIDHELLMKNVVNITQVDMATVLEPYVIRAEERAALAQILSHKLWYSEWEEDLYDVSKLPLERYVVYYASLEDDPGDETIHEAYLMAHSLDEAADRCREAHCGEFALQSAFRLENLIAALQEQQAKPVAEYEAEFLEAEAQNACDDDDDDEDYEDEEDEDGDGL